MTRLFLKMTAHDAMEATMSSSMTACTMTLASSTRVQIDKSLPITPLREQIFGNRTRSQRAGIEAGDTNICIDELNFFAHDPLLESDCGTAQAFEFRGDENFIIENGGTQKIHADAHDHELQLPFGAQSKLIDIQSPQPVGPATFHEFQVVRVIDHAAGVGIFP